MNLKHLCLTFLVLCALILSVSAISAADNSTDDIVGESDDVQLEQNNVETAIAANDSSLSSKNTSDTAKDTTNTTSNKTIAKKLKATAPNVYNTYKKKGSFKITIKDSNKKPMKKVKIKVKVYTGKKSKTYTLQTNSKGIATLSTKNLKRGTHKVIISSASKAYSLSKKAYIHIGVKKSLTLKLGKTKKFKNGDYFRFFKQSRNGQYYKGVYVENLRVYKGNLDGAKTHHLLKAKYTFKNIKGMTITKTSTSNNMCKTKLIIGYEPVSAKITYLQE